MGEAMISVPICNGLRCEDVRTAMLINANLKQGGASTCPPAGGRTSGWSRHSASSNKFSTGTHCSAAATLGGNRTERRRRNGYRNIDFVWNHHGGVSCKKGVQPSPLVSHGRGTWTVGSGFPAIREREKQPPGSRAGGEEEDGRYHRRCDIRTCSAHNADQSRYEIDDGEHTSECGRNGNEWNIHEIMNNVFIPIHIRR